MVCFKLLYENTRIYRILSSVRIDTGVCCNSSVQPYYDSLIAKVIVHGHTRGDAIQTMKRALSEYHISGIQTTVEFHRQLMQNPYFCCGDIDTQFINRQMNF